MITWVTLCAVLVAVGVVVQVEGHRRDRRALIVTAKPAASLVFVLLGLSRWSAGETVETWLLAALTLCMIGDVLLMWQRSFDAGLAVFLLGHIAYATAFHHALRVAAWPPLILVPLLALGLVVAIWLWPHLAGHRRVSVPAYIAAIAVMVWGAVATAQAGALASTALIGAVLFFLSDLTVARERFVTPSWHNRAIGLPLYYAGQLLLALTIAG